MIILTTTTYDVLSAVAVAAVVSIVGTLALSALRLRDQRRNHALLAEVKATRAALLSAAEKSEERDIDVIHDVLENAVEEVSADQRLPVGLIRGAIFARQADESLRILKGQTVGFASSDETNIRIQIGESGAGQAAGSGRPVITLFDSALEDSTIRDAAERHRIDPSLRWIIALPVFGAGPEVLWVLTVDGLVERRTQAELRSSVGHLLYYREILSLLLRTHTEREEVKPKS